MRRGLSIVVLALALTAPSVGADAAKGGGRAGGVSGEQARAEKQGKQGRRDELRKQRLTRWRGSGGWGERGAYQRLFDPRTMTTVRGRVQAIERIQPRSGMATGVGLVLATDGGPLPVHLGPSWFVDNQDVRVMPGDVVEVKGSRIDLDGRTVVIAAEVHHGSSVLTLRDERGVPSWSWQRTPEVGAAKP